MGKLFDELKQMKDAYDRKLKEEGEAAVKDAFKDIFEKFPELRSVVWTQYTPYFCDGDPCYFSVHEFCANIGTDEDIQKQIEEKKAAMKAAADAGKYEEAKYLRDDVDELHARLDGNDRIDYDAAYGLRYSKDPREAELGKAIYKLRQELPEEVMESVFGDHCKVVATRKGFEIQEHNHD